MPKRTKTPGIRYQLNASLKTKDKIAVSKFTKKFPKSIMGVRQVIGELQKILVDVNKEKRNNRQLREKEYNKSGEKMILQKQIKVPFRKTNPVYGCHQLSKALAVALRSMGIPAKIVRVFPDNESVVLFRLNKDLYEAAAFSGTIKKVDEKRRAQLKLNLKTTTYGVRNLRVKNIKNYNFSDFQLDLASKPNLD